MNIEMNAELKIINLNVEINGNKIINSLTITSNKKILGIIGKSGSGKSTLLKTISGIIYNEVENLKVNGKIKINGDEIDNNYIKNKCFYLSQDFLLIPTLTIEKNLKIVDENANLIDLIQKLGLNKKILKQYPNEISGGERQRIAIGQALLYKPEILLLDEPFSNLDLITKSDLRNFLKSILNEFKKVILITHDKDDLLELCDEAAVIHEGKLLNFGEPIDLIFNSSPDLLLLNIFNNKFEFKGRIYNIHKLQILKIDDCNFEDAEKCPKNTIHLFNAKVIDMKRYEFFNKLKLEFVPFSKGDKIEIFEVIDKQKEIKKGECVKVCVVLN